MLLMMTVRVIMLKGLESPRDLFRDDNVCRVVESLCIKLDKKSVGLVADMIIMYGTLGKFFWTMVTQSTIRRYRQQEPWRTNLERILEDILRRCCLSCLS